jgi:flagellar basal body-associated protein FliL
VGDDKSLQKLSLISILVLLVLAGTGTFVTLVYNPFTSNNQLQQNQNIPMLPSFNNVSGNVTTTVTIVQTSQVQSMSTSTAITTSTSSSANIQTSTTQNSLLTSSVTGNGTGDDGGGD